MSFIPITINEALKRWQEKHRQDSSEAAYVGLQLQWPPIEIMDNQLSVLKQCTRLGLSGNAIENISGIGSLSNLRILSLSKNQIKSLDGIEALGDTLEELWVSYNLIDELKAIVSMKKLRVLYMGHNKVNDWTEFNRLGELPNLKELLFLGNPLSMNENYRAEAIKILPNIKKLDCVKVKRYEYK